MRFKTNAIAQDSAEAIKKTVQKRFPNATLELETESTDKVLHIHGIPEDREHASEVERAIKEAGFEGSWLTRGLENK